MEHIKQAPTSVSVICVYLHFAVKAFWVKVAETPSRLNCAGYTSSVSGYRWSPSGILSTTAAIFPSTFSLDSPSPKSITNKQIKIRTYTHIHEWGEEVTKPAAGRFEAESVKGRVCRTTLPDASRTRSKKGVKHLSNASVDRTRGIVAAFFHGFDGELDLECTRQCRGKSMRARPLKGHLAVNSCGRYRLA